MARRLEAELADMCLEGMRLPSAANFLSILRDRNIGIADFRSASDEIARLLCADALTTIHKDGMGELMLVPVLRAGLALLPAFISAAPGAPVAFVGVERNEHTAQPNLYYTRFPAVKTSQALIIDPMLATAGTACLVAYMLMREGYLPAEIRFVGVLAAREGMQRLAEVIPCANIIVAAIDPELDASNFIVPGLGDYGDRYFGA